MQQDNNIEISETKVTTDVTRVPVGKRLRIAIEALPEGHEFTFRSSMERQHVYNIIAKIKKATGRNFTTCRLQRPDEEGKSIMRIVRTADKEEA